MLKCLRLWLTSLKGHFTCTYSSLSPCGFICVCEYIHTRDGDKERKYYVQLRRPFRERNLEYKHFNTKIFGFWYRSCSISKSFIKRKLVVCETRLIKRVNGLILDALCLIKQNRGNQGLSAIFQNFKKYYSYLSSIVHKLALFNIWNTFSFGFLWKIYLEWILRCQIDPLRSKKKNIMYQERIRIITWSCQK